jgi:hypothetical protein
MRLRDENRAFRLLVVVRFFGGDGLTGFGRAFVRLWNCQEDRQAKEKMAVKSGVEAMTI